MKIAYLILVIFISILSAKSIAMSGSAIALRQFAKKITWNKVGACNFLGKTKGDYKSICSKDKDFSSTISTLNNTPEIFSSMLVLEVISKLEIDAEIKNNIIKKLKSSCYKNGFYYFFTDHSLYPPDSDCTALANIALLKTNSVEHSSVIDTLNGLAKHVNKDGITEVYLDKERAGRIDPVVCANVLYLFYYFGLKHLVVPTDNYVFKTLLTEGYAGGTRYYPSEDMFLYAVSRLLEFPQLKENLSDILGEKLKKRINSTDNSFDLALRVICSKRLGVDNTVEAKILAKKQQPDGGWPIGAIFKFGQKDIFFGSREVITAFAIKALVDKVDDSY